ncbi:21786_t:CDS:2, partial [Gigaspora rosea]
YGKLPWESLFKPSIKLSREGFAVSAELALRLEGRIAKALVEEIQSKNGTIQEIDFKNYSVKIRRPIIGNYRGRKIITTPEPTSGPSLIFMLNLLENYEMPKNRLDVPKSKETVKQHEDRIKEIMSKEYAASIRANISDDHTFPVEYYKPKYDQPEDHGTTHISVIDKNGMAVNLIWGSQVLNLETGILLNDEMDDFSIPGRSNSFGLEPSPYNYIEPGKRPVSSTVPTIVENKDGKLELVAGGSGGSRILTAVLQVLLNVFDFDMNLEEAIDSLRIHHQLVPNSIGVERGFEYKLVDELIDKKHVV